MNTEVYVDIVSVVMFGEEVIKMNDKYLYFIDILHRQIEKNKNICGGDYPSWDEFINASKEKKLVCYGAGQIYSYFSERYGKQLRVNYVVDNLAADSIKDIDGIQIKHLRELAEDKEDKIILITVMSDVDNIAESLRQLGIDKEDIYVFSKMEYEKDDIKNSLERSFSDDMFFRLCEISYNNFLEIRQLNKKYNRLVDRFNDFYSFFLHTNKMVNVLIDRVDDNEELKKEQIREKFVRLHHNDYYPNLDNPRTFNEKLLSMSLTMDSDPIYSEVTDKYTFKKYVSERVGEKYVVPLFGVWDSPEEVDFDSLPNSFAIKATNGGDSTRVILVEDKKNMDMEQIRQAMEGWTKPYDVVYFNDFNASYKNIPNRIIAEELLNISNLEIYDYKIHCFNGVPGLVHVVRQHPHQVSAYTPEWEHVDFAFGYPQIDWEVKCPEQMDEMFRISKELSKPFRYVRVDFYLVEGKIYVGELTLTHRGGFGKITPKYWEEKLGNMIE